MGFYKYCYLSVLISFFIIFKVASQNLSNNYFKKQESVENIKEIEWQGIIYLSEDMIIEKGEILTVEPGTVVELQGYYSIDVHGCIHAIGNNENLIKFTINDTSGFSNFNSELGGWKGISFMADNDNTSSILEYCVIEYAKDIDNTVYGYGGGIYVNNYSNLEIKNCIIRINYARIGGGIMCSNSNILISHSFIYNNIAVDGGGGIFCVGSDVNIINNVIYSNISYQQGGGIFFQSCDTSTIINNTISDNSSYISGGGIYLKFNSNPEIINTIIFSNQAGLTGNQVGMSSNCFPSLYNCDIEGGKNDFALEMFTEKFEGIYQDNIDSLPLFINQSQHIYNIGKGSPCIDQGQNNSVSYLFDIEGNFRKWDGDEKNGIVIDIGAYEFGAPGKMIVKDSIKLVSSGTAKDGEIYISISKGLGPFTINLHNEFLYSSVTNNLTEGTYDFKELDAGLYFLDVYDSNGDHYYKTIDLGYSSVSEFSISGTVKSNGKNLDQGVVIAYKEENDHFLPYDITYVRNGQYDFENIDSSRYLLYAVPDPKYSENNVLPAFYASAYSWEQAYKLNVYGKIESVDINLLQKENMVSGNGEISGFIMYESGTKNNNILNENWFESEYNDEIDSGLMAKHVLVILEKEGKQLAWSYSDNTGVFNFNNLPNGEYSLLVQCPGYEMLNNPLLIINEEIKLVEDVFIIIRQNDIVIINQNNNVEELDVRIYPNPFNEYIEIDIADLNKVTFNISFYDMIGRRVLGPETVVKPALLNRITYNIKHLSWGVYKCYIETDNTKKGFKLIKK